MAGNEVGRLAADLTAAGPKMIAPMRGVFEEIGERTAEEWATIATGTSGEHGVHYPASIDSELSFSMNLSVDIGPNSAKMQGSMGRGFEFGSVNQPPHLDGLKAMEKMTPLAEVTARTAIDGLIP